MLYKKWNLNKWNRLLFYSILSIQKYSWGILPKLPFYNYFFLNEIMFYIHYLKILPVEG